MLRSWLSAILLSVLTLTAAVPDAFRNGFRLAGYQVRLCGIATDGAGNIYLAGDAVSANAFAGIPDRVQFGPMSDSHIFVAKITSSMQTLAYLAEFSGSQSSTCGAFAVDAAGNAYLGGRADSADFAAARNPFQQQQGVSGPFVLKLAASGDRIVYARSVDRSNDTRVITLAAGSAGTVYVGGGTQSPSFTTTPGAYQRTPGSARGTGFLMELDAAGSPVFATFLNAWEWISAIRVSGNGTLDFAGGTASSGSRGRLAADGSRLLYSTAADGLFPVGLAIDPTGQTWLVGASVDRPTINMWDASDSLRYRGSVLRGATVQAWLPLANGHLLIGGVAQSPDFETRRAILPCSTNLAGTDWSDNHLQGFLAEIDGAGTVVFSTLLGGYAVDGLATGLDGNVLVTGIGGFGFSTGATFGSSVARIHSRYTLTLDLSKIPTTGPAPSCLVDGATFQATTLARGSFATLYGSALGPAEGASAAPTEGRIATTFAGTQITVGGIPAPILYASDRQVNFLVPQNAPESAEVCVSRDSTRNCLFSRVAAVQPAVFRIGPGGAASAVLNENGTLNTAQSPAPRGSVVTIYGTGFGPTLDALPDGYLATQANPLQAAVKATFHDPRDSCRGIGGGCVLFPTLQGTIVYAGTSPGSVHNLTQINVRVPSFPQPGTSKLDLSVGPAASTTTVVYIQ